MHHSISQILYLTDSSVLRLCPALKFQSLSKLENVGLAFQMVRKLLLQLHYQLCLWFTSPVARYWISFCSVKGIWRNQLVCVFNYMFVQPSEDVRSCEQQMPSDCQEESCWLQSITDRTLLCSCHCLAMHIPTISDFDYSLSSDDSAVSGSPGDKVLVKWKHKQWCSQGQSQSVSPRFQAIDSSFFLIWSELKGYRSPFKWA